MLGGGTPGRALQAQCATIFQMTDWKKTAAALDPPIPETDVEKLLPVMEALENAFRPLQATLTAESDVWTGPEDLA
jgi:hypothetical protein